MGAGCDNRTGSHYFNPPPTQGRWGILNFKIIKISHYDGDAEASIRQDPEELSL